MAGGLNEKTPEAAAIWRQGNLLEFGFEISPQKLNETGRAVLLNSIIYISKFTEDRPIQEIPMIGARRILPRASLARYADDESITINILEEFLTKETIEAAPGRDRESYKKWFLDVLTYFCPDDTLKYCIDAEALSLGIHFDQPDFFQKAISMLHSGGDEADAARILLERYVPEGPAKGSDPGTWERWIEQNSPYIFFSELGGFRWYIDPLARKRRVPSAELRGPARADSAKLSLREYEIANSEE